MKLIVFLVVILAVVALTETNPIHRIKEKFYARIQRRLQRMRIAYDQVVDSQSIAERAWNNMQICVNEYMVMRSIRDLKRCLRSHVRTAMNNFRDLEANHVHNDHSFDGYGNKYGDGDGHGLKLGHELGRGHRLGHGHRHGHGYMPFITTSTTPSVPDPLVGTQSSVLANNQQAVGNKDIITTTENDEYVDDDKDQQSKE